MSAPKGGGGLPNANATVNFCLRTQGKGGKKTVKFGGRPLWMAPKHKLTKGIFQYQIYDKDTIKLYGVPLIMGEFSRHYLPKQASERSLRYYNI